ncbi:unnamed protein product [Leptosia nina]|uniref:Cytoplasmic dynein 2 light intermediate chain 1 n=1 Tax=Leptosia nina TaxID=320188 RepID=A0AAV1IWJ3_9NEOP
MSLPDIASQLVKESFADSNYNKTSSTIIMAGSKYVGKSTIINSFLEKNENPKETLVLEYSFGRKSSQKPGGDKSICHVWEYGGKIEMLKDVLTSIPVHQKFFFCIVIDLSKGRNLWSTLEACLEAIEKNYTAPNLLPEIILIGGNYHLFKNLDSETKKIICLTLRSIAVIYRAHVVFYSHKEATLVRRLKELCYGMAFGKGFSLKEKNTNLSKPLVIPKGTDSWENIGVPISTLTQIKLRYAAKIAMEQETDVKQFSQMKRTHPEPVLDTLTALKCEDLVNMEYCDPSIKDYLYCLN